ncbi:acyl-CoA dehydrogenase NM domain-like protein [Rhizopus microsporus var. microsporus]|uniref:Acyl-CoA dehydrogenase NM domain-like protein n=2 Tax=Rhizopus microsporus TaxID=58291 RepID=A0A2G4SHU7_RHIZD|nr:acyl-CoA dehydrogenase NM domain-like protein [Rhizopus microsporus ATCC 52813]ORE08307.1 acyl-CoA dehydrogenase NM domain-like protein [Rhizopus microsporus var. microsporus]PHZ08357.1 acyl-CoA dehydrogenase NM domain-like protein [Rhizopus microsporus ATCC 52813]
MKTFTVEEVAKHNKADDIWIIIDGKVFDLTKFINDHPGGKKVLLKKAGKDASKEFKTFHNEAIMQRLGLPMQIGVIGTAETAKPEATAPSAVEPQPAPVTTNVTKTTDIRQLVSNDQARFGEGIPYGDPTWYQDWNSPYYKDSHIKLRKEIRAFVDKEVMPYCHEWSEAKAVPHAVVKRAAELGILNIASGASKKPGNAKYMKYPLPAGLTVEEFDIFHEFVCIDEIARCGSGGFIWALMGGLGIGLPPVLNFGSEELKAKVVPGCLSGEKFIALAVTEPSAGSDVANLKTTAKDMGDYYLLNGEKKWITQGGYADYYTVACRTGGPGMGGVSLLLVERTMPGVNARFMDCQGMWGSGTSYITFEDVKVPKSHIIGKVNHGFRYIMHNFNHERLGIVMQANRLARVCIEEALKYSLKRKTFGQRLIEHAVIRNKLGHMIRQCEATHAWLESVLYQVQTLPENVTPNLLAGPIALLKAQSTQTFEFCAREASQIFGGLAYTRGGQGEKIERLYREVRAYAIPGGSEEIMLDLGVRQALSKAIAASKPKL